MHILKILWLVVKALDGAERQRHMGKNYVQESKLELISTCHASSKFQIIKIYKMYMKIL